MTVSEANFRQDVGPGENLFPLFILAQDRIPERVYDQHAPARQRRAPRVGVVIRLQRAQFGELRAPAAADDLPFRPDIPQRQQVGAVGAGCVQFAEAAQRIVVGREHAGQIADFAADCLAEVPAACAQKLGHGAHLGRAAAAEQKRLAAVQAFGGQVVALLRRQHRHAAVLPAKARAFIKVARQFTLR